MDLTFHGDPIEWFTRQYDWLFGSDPPAVRVDPAGAGTTRATALLLLAGAGAFLYFRRG